MCRNMVVEQGARRRLERLSVDKLQVRVGGVAGAHPCRRRGSGELGRGREQALAAARLVGEERLAAAPLRLGGRRRRLRGARVGGQRWAVRSLSLFVPLLPRERETLWHLGRMKSGRNGFELPGTDYPQTSHLAPSARGTKFEPNRVTSSSVKERRQFRQKIPVCPTAVSGEQWATKSRLTNHQSPKSPCAHSLPA